MRDNKAKDYWNRIEKVNVSNYCSSVSLNGLNGFDEPIVLSNKIQVLCGLNGAGKSTVLAAVKSILGLSLTEQDTQKLDGTVISGDVVYDGNKYTCLNGSEKRLLDVSECEDNLHYYDYFLILSILDFICRESNNIDDLLMQNECVELEEKDLQSINYLIGKNYKKIELCVIEDIDEFDSIPFFTVEDGSGRYDSREMGTGEYALLYFYWIIYKSNNSINVIEEPESFIAINSQRRLMNLIAESIITKKNSFIISTHSPFILQDVNNKYIKILSKAIGKSSVQVPTNNNCMEQLGLKEKNLGVIYVEDDMAKDFFEVFCQKENIPINKYFDIKIAGGSGEITALLQQEILRDLDFLIIGIYDEDQKLSVPDTVKLPYTFLPPEKDVECTIYNLINSKNNMTKICKKLCIKEDDYIRILSKLEGADRHDWFSEFTRETGLSQKLVIEKMYDIWKKGKSTLIKSFISDLNKIVKL